MLSEELQRLEQMRADGQLTEEEFQRAKEQVLNAPATGAATASPDGMIQGMAPNTWCMLMHLSQFAGFITGGLGFVAPIVMWLIAKDQSVQADRHGKIIVNWLISSVIYIVVSVILTFVLIGIPMLVILAIVGIVFPIIGAVKANDNLEWKYPMSIEFLKLDTWSGTESPNYYSQ